MIINALLSHTGMVKRECQQQWINPPPRSEGGGGATSFTGHADIAIPKKAPNLAAVGWVTCSSDIVGQHALFTLHRAPNRKSTAYSSIGERRE